MDRGEERSYSDEALEHGEVCTSCKGIAVAGGRGRGGGGLLELAGSPFFVRSLRGGGASCLPFQVFSRAGDTGTMKHLGEWFGNMR